MKNDTQHLEFLISQYVDGTLDASTKKTVEQELVRNRDAREIYREQQEVQDVLDDYGSRLPWINWDEFDSTLAKKLEAETVGTPSRYTFTRWTKSIAVAASLLIAAGAGYSWRALTASDSSNIPVAHQNNAAETAPLRGFSIEENAVSRTANRGSVFEFRVDEVPNKAAGMAQSTVDIIPSAEESVAGALGDAVRYGRANSLSNTGVQTQPSSVTADSHRRDVPEQIP